MSKHDVKNAVSKLSALLGKNATSRLLCGVGSGWITGMVFVRVGKSAALVIGTGVIAFQLAQNHGLVKSNWEEVANKAENMHKEMLKENRPGALLSKAKTFAKGNTAFAAGFTGGFLLGLAT